MARDDEPGDARAGAGRARVAARGCAARAGSAPLLSFGAAASFLDIGLRPVVPGANDNLSAVAAMLAVARRLAEEPVHGVRVLLVSTGSEESFEEGMSAFIARHEHELDRGRPTSSSSTPSARRA
jgi:Zn-dependent M28 family amino/carboxypeptidase